MMTVECGCGASFSIEDASYQQATELLASWHGVHGRHRRSIDEYREWLAAVHRKAEDPITNAGTES